jgi:hypothetical protein
MHAKLQSRNLRNRRADDRIDWPPERKARRLRLTGFHGQLWRVFSSFRIYSRGGIVYRPEA